MTNEKHQQADLIKKDLDELRLLHKKVVNSRHQRPVLKLTLWSTAHHENITIEDASIEHILLSAIDEHIAVLNIKIEYLQKQYNSL